MCCLGNDDFIFSFVFGMSFAVGFILGIIGGVTNNEGIMNIFEGYMGLLFDALMFVVALFLFKKFVLFLKEVLTKKQFMKEKRICISYWRFCNIYGAISFIPYNWI